MAEEIKTIVQYASFIGKHWLRDIVKKLREELILTDRTSLLKIIIGTITKVTLYEGGFIFRKPGELRKNRSLLRLLFSLQKGISEILI
jgi:hypothetical protein